MALDDLLATMERRDSVTPVTPCFPDGVTAKPAPIQACTPVTPVTPQNDNAATATPSHGWLLHFADSDLLEVHFNPPAYFDKVMAIYPDALAAEPIPARNKRTPTEAEANELRALVQIVGERYLFTDAEMAEALDAAHRDPEGAWLSYRAMARELCIDLSPEPPQPLLSVSGKWYFTQPQAQSRKP